MEEGRSAATADPEETAMSGAAPRLHQRLRDILAGQIREGVLAPGALLMESQVASRFGTSRAPARQALAGLKAAGLVRKADGPGYLVAGRPSARSDTSPPAPSAPLPPEERLTPSVSWERIYAEIESEIAARTSFATWRVNESELARHYQVSRTVARDVLARLQQRGLIKKDAQSRWYAPALTPDYVGELYQMRWLLEPVALKEALPSVPTAFLQDMRRHLEDAISSADRLEGRDLDRLEKEIHVDLLAHCGNRTLMEAIGLYQSLLIAHTFLYGWMPRMFDAEPFLPEHLAIVERLCAGHADEAAAALERHLKVSRERAVERIARAAREIEPKPLAYLQVLKT